MNLFVLGMRKLWQEERENTLEHKVMDRGLWGLVHSPAVIPAPYVFLLEKKNELLTTEPAIKLYTMLHRVQ